MRYKIRREKRIAFSLLPLLEITFSVVWEQFHSINSLSIQKKKEKRKTASYLVKQQNVFTAKHISLIYLYNCYMSGLKINLFII